MTSLEPETRERLNAMLDIALDLNVDRRALAEEAITDLRSEAGCGDEEAEHIIAWLAEEGFDLKLGQRAKARRRSVVIEPSTGRRFDLSACASVPKRDANGAKNGGRQLSYWKSLSEEEWADWSRGQRAIAAGFDVKRRTMDKVDEAWAKYHGVAQTTEDACQMAGLDPDAVDLDLAI